ncbi:myotubularin [Thecamonas trahens ATCC 50062]|uniref:Myotubularin n=1 Tax=Thecamonas trahens ATCC 50062 TaxID=461836 RepID=A0A0L0DHZ3_THETB|nr:myotubularin [Thecamonas trahens ATCC 50062]KNC51927.1 myotubularin [Thecamonas trahens ATCC 50062]|eukprot:XP_013755523.1 myotubularin [Thecamonas trahens ATCC 50062]
MASAVLTGVVLATESATEPASASPPAPRPVPFSVEIAVEPAALAALAAAAAAPSPPPAACAPPPVDCTLPRSAPVPSPQLSPARPQLALSPGITARTMSALFPTRARRAAAAAAAAAAASASSGSDIPLVETAPPSPVPSAPPGRARSLFPGPGDGPDSGDGPMIRITAAEHLPSNPLADAAHLYCVVALPTGALRTGLAPIVGTRVAWDELLVFDELESGAHAAHGYIWIHVWQHNPLDADVCLGSTFVPLAQVGVSASAMVLDLHAPVETSGYAAHAPANHAERAAASRGVAALHERYTLIPAALQPRLTVEMSIPGLQAAERDAALATAASTLAARAPCWAYPHLESPEQIELVFETGVVASVGGEVLDGVVILTNMRLCFFEAEAGRDCSSRDTLLSCALPLGLIACVDRTSQLMLHNGLTSVAGLTLTSRRTDVLHLFFTLAMSGSVLDGLEARLAWYAETQAITPLTCELAAAIGARPRTLPEFDFDAEFERQGVPQSVWRQTAVNQDYRLTPTYPRTLYVPAAVDDDVVRGSAAFRSRARLPVLAWYCARNGAVICRSAQPLTGLKSSTSADDVALVAAIRDSVHDPQRAVIIDCRSSLAATGNRIIGKGTENMAAYPGCDLRFMGIDNIHEMRRSFAALQTLCTSSSAAAESDWLAALQTTRWMEHTRDILVAALRVVLIVSTGGQAVTVHCSDSWDRTPQIVSLAQLLLDPYFRTTAGFEALVAKEWMAFGHKFATRLGLVHGLGRAARAAAPNAASPNAESESDPLSGTSGAQAAPASRTSPVFVQFLDCVEQVRAQFPAAFEFTSEYLAAWADAASSTWFGDFAFDNSAARTAVSAAQLSVFDYFAAAAASPAGRPHRNRGYAPDVAPDVLLPVTSIKVLKLWSAYYLRYDAVFFRRFGREAEFPPPAAVRAGPILWVPDDFQLECYACLAAFKSLAPIVLLEAAGVY